MSLNEFFTGTIGGIITLSIIGSIVSYFIVLAITFLFRRIEKKCMRKKHIKYLVEAEAVFGSGCKTEYAKQKGSFHQILLVGDFLKDVIILIGKILFIAIIALCLFVVFRDYWFSLPIIVTVACIFIFFEYKRLKVCLRVYNEMIKYVFGEDYFKEEMEGIKNYWDKITKI